MSACVPSTKFVIISPVKDEEKYIESTIRSVLGQTVKPTRWVIVDDGSRDRTADIVSTYCKEFDWITIIKAAGGSKRQPGSAVIHAFNKGYELIKHEKFDFIVKLDCDLSFGPDYFERIFREFENDEKLGIASGVYLENKGKGLLPIEMPVYHAAGASKVVRAQCFREIGGFIPRKGWDTVDEIKAQYKGWKTQHFKEIEFHHLKIEGSGIGRVRTNRMHGEIYYLTGGSRLFFLLKLIHRMVYGSPVVLGGLMMLVGYVTPLIKGEELLVDDNEASFYKKLLLRRLLDKVKIHSMEPEKSLE